MNKFVASCLQRRFPADSWSEAENILALYCGDSLAFPHVHLQPYVSNREIQRWRHRIQLQVINMAAGDINQLRKLAMGQAKNARRSPDSLWEAYTAWLENYGKPIGIENMDYNNSLTLIRAPMDAIGESLPCATVEWNRNVLEQNIRVDRAFFLVFQYGQSEWVQLLGNYDAERLGNGKWQRILSERLEARVIHYIRSDSVSSVGYRLFENGKLLEEMSTQTDDWRTGEDWFVSYRSALALSDLTGISRFDVANQLFVEEEAYEPGVELSDLLCAPSTEAEEQDHRTWRTVCYPDFDNKSPDVGTSWTLSRIDYVALGEVR